MSLLAKNVERATKSSRLLSLICSMDSQDLLQGETEGLDSGPLNRLKPFNVFKSVQKAAILSWPRKTRTFGQEEAKKRESKKK